MSHEVAWAGIGIGFVLMFWLPVARLFGLGKKDTAPGPNWPICAALFAIDPHLLDSNAWEADLRRLHDLLASGEVIAWGRRDSPIQREAGPLAPIRTDFWSGAQFTGEVLRSEKTADIHAYARIALGNMREQYSDLHFNRAALTAAWKRAR